MIHICLALVLLLPQSTPDPRVATERLLPAVANGRLPEVDGLVRAGADVNGRGMYGMTPLALAAREGYDGIVRLLLSAGADLNLAIGGGYTPLMLASMHGHINVVDALISSGAKRDIANLQGRTALLEAAESGQAAVVKMLIEHGYAVGTDDPIQSALMLSVRMGSSGQADTLGVLIAAGADVKRKSKGGDTPLAVAAFYGHKPAIDVLLSNGADPNDATADGITPLMAAGMNEASSSIDILLSHGAKLDAQNSDGRTALMVAAERSPEVTRLLIQRGADVNLRDKRGRTALMLASAARNEESAAAILIQGGPKPTGANPLAICRVRTIEIRVDGSDAIKKMDEFRWAFRRRGFETCIAEKCSDVDATLHIKCKAYESQWSVAVGGETPLRGSPGVACEYSLLVANSETWREREKDAQRAAEKLKSAWSRSKTRECR